MRTHLLQIACNILLPLVLAGCQETSTDPQGEEKADGSTLNRGASARARTPSFTTTSGRVTHSHFVSNGKFGEVNWLIENSDGSISLGVLSVNRGGTTNNPQTLLFFFGQQCETLFNCSSFDGAGLIPNQDLRGTHLQDLHLNTNTSGNPNFVGTVGLVTVDWQANGLITETERGTHEIRIPGFTERSQGQSNFTTATATGSVVGVPIPPIAGGDIGTRHEVTIDIIR